MRKWILSTLTLVLCFTAFSIHAAAAETNDAIRLNADIEEAPEYASLVRLEEELLGQLQVLAEKAKLENLPTSIDFTKMVRVFVVDHPNSADAVTEAKESRSYYYRIPLMVDTGYVFATASVEKGTVTGYETSMTPDKTLGQVSYLFEEGLAGDILADFEGEIDEIAVFTIPAIQTDFVSFTSEGKAYAIPFASRPDLLKLDNGEICELDQFLPCADAFLREMQGDEYEENQGGKNTGILVFIIVAVFLAATGIFFLVRKKRRSLK